MDPFDDQFFDSLGVFSAHMGDKGCIVYNNQVGGLCCRLDAGDCWIFFRTFWFLEVPIEQNMAGFLGWITGVIADLLDWVVGVRSSACDGAGSRLQVMDFASVLMRFLLVCGGLGVFPLYLADKYWPCYQSPVGVRYDACLVERLHQCFLSFMLALATICA